MALILSAAASPSVGTASTAHIQPNSTPVDSYVVGARDLTEDSTMNEASTIFEATTVFASPVTGSAVIITSFPGATDSLYSSSPTSFSTPPATTTSSSQPSNASPKLSFALGAGLLVGLALLAAMM
ncbi:hypothetical protein EG329_001425 [Mollisiaceae sp. DMI_Dod_QoI]|nr:hypothetical protein EG329_001425 [Helotiales sp. DMI_Dod_QoI]